MTTYLNARGDDIYHINGSGNRPLEVDVIETIGPNPSRLILTAHSQAAGNHTEDRHLADVADTDGFHRYGVLWTEEELVWTYDGVEVVRGDLLHGTAEFGGGLEDLVSIENVEGGLGADPLNDLVDDAASQLRVY